MKFENDRLAQYPHPEVLYMTMEVNLLVFLFYTCIHNMRTYGKYIPEVYDSYIGSLLS